MRGCRSANGEALLFVTFTGRHGVLLRSLARQSGLLLVTVAGTLGAQQAQFEPTNKAPNPYQTVVGWAKLPEGRSWGSLSAVDIDTDGVSVWVAERCGANSCATSNLPPIMKFDSTGTLVKAFGAGLLISPHGMYVDREGNVWVTDCA